MLTESALYTMIRTELFGGGGRCVGLELELFPVMAGNSTISVPLHCSDGGPSLRALLERLACMKGGEYLCESDNAARVTLPGGGCITLEPAGQVEYSGPPFEDAVSALADLRSAINDLVTAGNEVGIDFFARGYNNMMPEENIELLIHKPRYLAMDSHFSSIGPYGRRMMRATCSLQINLDFGADSRAPERWRLANMIAPSLNAIFANSPHVHEGRSYRSFRYEIWRHTDPGRTGRLYDRPDLDPIADYLRFALDASVMFVPDGEDGLATPRHPMTFREWLKGSQHHGVPDRSDWQRHLTTLFPDVRARGWMELRSIDCLPSDLWDVPVALASTLLYDDAVRSAALERLETRPRRRDIGSHEHNGFWRADYQTGAELLELAIPAITNPALAAAARHYQREYIMYGRTPGEAVRDNHVNRKTRGA